MIDASACRLAVLDDPTAGRSHVRTCLDALEAGSAVAVRRRGAETPIDYRFRLQWDRSVTTVLASPNGVVRPGGPRAPVVRLPSGELIVLSRGSSWCSPVCGSLPSRPTAVLSRCHAQGEDRIEFVGDVIKRR